MGKSEIFAEERAQIILGLLKERSRITIQELEESLKISGSTIRRQLKHLESEGKLIRTHGGAIVMEDSSLEEPLERKFLTSIKEKKSIAEVARKYIHDGDIIALGGGTTILELAKLLRDIKELVVITDSILTAAELYKNPNIEVQIAGGIIRNVSGVIIGSSSIRFLEHAFVDKTFIGADSISIEYGITTPNSFEAEVEGKLVTQGKTVFVLADNTKFNKITLAKQSSLEDIDYIITNDSADKDYVKKIESFGIEVLFT